MLTQVRLKRRQGSRSTYTPTWRPPGTLHRRTENYGRGASAPVHGRGAHAPHVAAHVEPGGALQPKLPVDVASQRQTLLCALFTKALQSRLLLVAPTSSHAPVPGGLLAVGLPVPFRMMLLRTQLAVAVLSARPSSGAPSTRLPTKLFSVADSVNINPSFRPAGSDEGSESGRSFMRTLFARYVQFFAPPLALMPFSFLMTRFCAN